MPADLITPAYLLKLQVAQPAYARDEPRDERHWLQTIPCRLGHIGIHSETDFYAHAPNGRVMSKLRDAGFEPLQEGDTEANFRVPPNRLKEAATILSARRRRLGRPDAASHLSPHQFKSRLPERLQSSP